MRTSRTLAALGLVTAAAAAHADLTSTVTLANDYDFRGISQSAKDPALQASLDFAADAGWYAGAWASNVDFGSEADYEVDLYAGFAQAYESGLGWDVGVVYYAFPGESDINYYELYGSVSYDWFKAKLWFAPAFGGDAAEDLFEEVLGEDDASALYLEGNATIPLPQNFSLLLHAGYSAGDYWDSTADVVNVIAGTNLDGEYFDYSIGVGYTAGRFNLALKYVDTDTDLEVTTDELNNEGRVLFTVATTFPWRDE